MFISATGAKVQDGRQAQGQAEVGNPEVGQRYRTAGGDNNTAMGACRELDGIIHSKWVSDGDVATRMGPLDDPGRPGERKWWMETTTRMAVAAS